MEPNKPVIPPKTDPEARKAYFSALAKKRKTNPGSFANDPLRAAKAGRISRYPNRKSDGTD